LLLRKKVPCLKSAEAILKLIAIYLAIAANEAIFLLLLL